MGFPMQIDATFAPMPCTVTPRRHFMMFTPRAQAAYQHQQFFFEQKERLSSLLITVGHDAKIAPFGSQVGNDYFELTTFLTQLLEEAQLASGFTFDQIERSGLQMQSFAEKVQLVDQVAIDVRARAVAAAAEAAAVKPTVSRKRGRAMDDEEDETPFEYKRYRHIPAQPDMMFEPVFCGPSANPFLQSALWSQPMCE